MFTAVERMLAWRYMKARRGFIALTSWFAILGITLGVATLILVTSLMNGIREEMTSRFIGIDGHMVVVTQGPFTNYRATTDLIAETNAVTSVTAKIEGQVMASAHGQAFGAQVIAMPARALLQRSLLKESMSELVLQSLSNNEGVVLGERLARNLGLRAGDRVTLISPRGRSTIAGFIPRMKDYPVVGTLKLGMHEFDGALILMPFADAQTYFLLNENDQDAISSLEIMVRNADDAPAIADIIQEKLGDAYRVYPWQQSRASVFAALAVQRNVMVVILALIILVAAFNIISSLVMLVKDKSHDIAILRTLGATKISVMRVFVLVGTTLGALGILAGVGLGLLLAANIEAIHTFVERISGQELLIENIYFLSSLPTKTDPSEVVVIVAIAMILSFLATLYPARRAASLDPVEALRYE